MSLNRTNEAISLLKTITASNNDLNSEHNFIELANWYLALAYLQLDEIGKASKQFSVIANDKDDVYKKEEAGQILKYLN